MSLERNIEAYLVKRCKEIGALCDKFVSPQRRAVPDRIVIFKGNIVFVELKAPGKRPTVAQEHDHSRRRAAGATVLVIDSIESVDAFVVGISPELGVGI